MNTLDIILLVLLLIAAVAGWRKGIIVQACGIAGLVLGILFAMRFSRTIGDGSVRARSSPPCWASS